MKKLLASIVLFVSSCSPVWASYQECILEESQLSVLQFSYERGLAYDLGLSLAAIAYRESRAGLWKINLQDPSAGYYHVTLDKVIRRMGWDYNSFNLNRAAQLLIDDPYLSSDLAIEELQYWQSRRGTNNWRAVWASYNAGNAGLSSSRGEFYSSEISRIISKIKRCGWINEYEVDDNYRRFIVDSRNFNGS